MKKLPALLLTLLLAAPAFAQFVTPGVGGLPQRPRFQTVTATSSVATPLVGTTTDVRFDLQVGGAGRWTIFPSGNNYDLLPTNADNGQSLGAPANRVKQVFTPIVDSGTTLPLLLKTNNGAGAVLTLANTGALSSNKACAANYTRLGPNFCLSAQSGITDAWADATACTNRTFSQTLPADAKAVAIELRWQTLSNNAIAARSGTVFFWTEAACTNQIAASIMTGREYVATVAGTTLDERTDHMIVPLTGTNQITTTQNNAGGNGNADVTSVRVTGYFD